MSALRMEFDNTLKKSEIIIPLKSTSGENATEENNQQLSDVDQTKVFGIVSPLIMINSTVINFNDIISFELKSVGAVPTLNMIVNDSYKNLSCIDTVGVDNEVRVQILPQFDNVYKKINLTFYISNININNTVVSLSCIYKVPDLSKSQLKSFGSISTYDLFKTIALETKMGYQTNTTNIFDNRYVYCANNSYLDTLMSEISRSDSSENIFDWWIDFWDNINLVDIKERYYAVDKDEDMKIYVSNNPNDISMDTGKIEPVLAPAILSDHPSLNGSELYVQSHTNNIRSGINYSSGTDNIYTTYNEINKEHSDVFLQNGDVWDDIYTKYSYKGEVYEKYNYLITSSIREKFIQKMYSEYVTVTLNKPMFGLIRGGKVNFIHYVNDDMLKNRMKSLEELKIDGKPVLDRKTQSNIPLDTYELDNSDESDSYMLDRAISGQYLITGIEILYSSRMWKYKLTLVKPLASKPKLITIDKK